MLTIASNISTREPEIKGLIEQWAEADWEMSRAPEQLVTLLERCVETGADALEINTQQHEDYPQAVEALVKLVQQVSDKQLCLSTNNSDALEAGLKACRRPPFVNYVSMDEGRLKEVLPLIVRYKAGVVFLVSEPAAPTDARDMLEKAAILVGVASEQGLPGERVLIDPGLVHITSDQGQRHLTQVMEFLRGFGSVFDTPVRSTCWLGNSSAGAPADLRPAIEMALLPMLAALGLSSVFIDVLRPEAMRTVRLIEVLNGETVYAEAELGNSRSA
jgi:cobalamin-dependent methionine synthase I